jgi:hypothetical protein
MTSYFYSDYHKFLVLALAKEINEYSKHNKTIDEKLLNKDIKGNSQIITIYELEKTQELQIKINILCASYIELLANLYLSIKLKTKCFKKLERKSTKEKWTKIIPKLIKDKTKTDESIHRIIENLFSSRNAIIHMKPSIESNDQIIQKGNTNNIANEKNHIKEWDLLPSKLINYIKNKDQSQDFIPFYALTFIEQYNELRKTNPL